MAFKVRDLMLNVAAGRGLDGPNTIHIDSFECGGTLRFHAPWANATLVGTTCVALGEDPVVVSQQLAILKAQLKAALADVESQERIVNESLEPQTVEQVEELERELEKALDELARRRDELGRKRTPRTLKPVARRRRKT
jgi:DNA anti-recombination protein RmuC